MLAAYAVAHGSGPVYDSVRLRERRTQQLRRDSALYFTPSQLEIETEEEETILDAGMTYRCACHFNPPCLQKKKRHTMQLPPGDEAAIASTTTTARQNRDVSENRRFGATHVNVALSPLSLFRAV